MMFVKLSALYKVKHDYYDDIYQEYKDRFGKYYRARGPIEVCLYNPNEQYNVPEQYPTTTYLETNQTVLVVDIIDSETYNYSHSFAKKVVKSFQRHVIFLWDEKTYFIDNELFLKIMEECK